MVDKGKLNKRRWGGCYPNLAVGFSLYCQEWEQSGHHGPYLGPEFKKQLSGVRADKCPKCPHDLQMAMRGSAGSGWCHSKPFHCCHPLINNFDVTAQKVTKIVSGRLWNLQWGCLKCLLGPPDWVVVNSTVVRAMSILLTLKDTIAISYICTPKYYYEYIARGI